MLVLDDDIESSLSLSNKLGQCGARCENVYAPLDAIQVMRDHSIQSIPFDMFIIDVKTGLFDWRDIVSTLRKDTDIQPLHIVVLTSFGQRGFGEVAKEIGVAGYMTKPLSDNELLTGLSLIAARDPSSKNTLVTKYSISESIGCCNDRVLVVENNLQRGRQISRNLANANIKADFAINENEAIEALFKIPYGLILIGISTINSIDAALIADAVKTVDEKKAVVRPVIAYYQEAEAREQFINAAVSEFVLWPVDSQKIKSALPNTMKKTG